MYDDNDDGDHKSTGTDKQIHYSRRLKWTWTRRNWVPGRNRNCPRPFRDPRCY